VIDEHVVLACGACEANAKEEKCGDGIDNDCDGNLEEGCGCTSSELDCFPGPPEKAGVGVCEKGTMECLEENYGACAGAELPTLELCGADGTGNGKDDNCDGKTDEGCICTPGETRNCGSSTGICERGTQECQSDATWGACEGHTPPDDGETCNAKDDDCDGLVDENVKNACGKCGAYCYTDTTDPTKEGSTEDGSKKIGKNDPDNPTNRGGVTLEKKDTFPPHLWAANHDDDTVSKFHTDNKNEIGRYWVGENPSRTAVDLDGNMWVVTRDTARVTKVISDHSDCIDRNNNGSIETSRPSSLGPVNSAGDPLADECVAMSDIIHPGNPSRNSSGNGGGVAVDSSGTVWVGYGNVTSQGGIQSVNPRTNQPSGMLYVGSGTPLYAPDSNNVYRDTGNTTTPGQIYGLVGDSEGNIYATHAWMHDGYFSRFDTTTNSWERTYELEGHGCEPYGIALDGNDRVFFGCVRDAGVVGMYDSANDKLTVFNLPSGMNISQGATGTTKTNCSSCKNPSVTALAVEPKTGDVWAAIRNSGMIGRLDLDNNNLANSTWTIIDAFPNTSGGFSTRGIGFDPKGGGWHMGPNRDDIVEIDPSQNQQVGNYDVGTSGHYTYSDFTGSTAVAFTAPRGIWRYFLDTKFQNAEPDELVLEAYVPSKTSLKVRMRALDGSNNPTSMWIPRQGGQQTWWTYPAGSSKYTIDVKMSPGALISGQIFEVEVRLQTQSSNQQPILYDVKLRWQRP